VSKGIAELVTQGSTTVENSSLIFFQGSRIQLSKAEGTMGSQQPEQAAAT